MARLANSLVTLRNQVNALWPNRNKASDGWLGDAAHQAVKSEHNPNSAGVVTALDITHDPAHGADMNQLKESLIRDSRTWYVIFNRRIWEAGVWKAYYGSNPHDKHLHISVKQSATVYDNGSQWNLTGKEGTPLTLEDKAWISQELNKRDQRMDKIEKLINTVYNDFVPAIEKLKVEIDRLNNVADNLNKEVAKLKGE